MTYRENRLHARREAQLAREMERLRLATIARRASDSPREKSRTHARRGSR